uniref:AAA ATPase AAA+ lid domain-containing protein n=1 Tax=Strombidium inclinatum TaxID=197538 RepID=A0A7S3IZ58_9SPIT|mmetsp:Transcript_5736/g.9117  ORF Transcript_5736/g.9117 Transcript_5736/m.9117 type:complete len:104 (+) Transcript_5736:1223-1534(+)
MLDINMRGLDTESDIDWDFIVKKTEGYSGADIANVCREAAMMPLRRRLKASGINVSEIEQLRKEIDVPVSMQDFRESLQNIQKSVSKANLEFYDEWMKQFGAV